MNRARLAHGSARPCITGVTPSLRRCARRWRRRGTSCQKASDSHEWAHARCPKRWRTERSSTRWTSTEKRPTPGAPLRSLTWSTQVPPSIPPFRLSAEHGSRHSALTCFCFLQVERPMTSPWWQASSPECGLVSESSWRMPGPSGGRLRGRRDSDLEHRSSSCPSGTQRLPTASPSSAAPLMCVAQRWRPGDVS